MRIFVTGATGYIGCVVTAKALAEGHAVYGLSRSEEGDAKLKALGATAVRGELASLDVLRQQSAQAEVVLHLGYIHDFTMDFQEVLRIDAAAVDAEVRRLAGPKVEVKASNPPLASPPSPLRPDVMKVVEGLTEERFPGVPVVPSMSTGATDSRFLRNLGMPMYGVSGLFVDPADNRIHGLDERIEIARLYAGREFMYEMVKRLAQ